MSTNLKLYKGYLSIKSDLATTTIDYSFEVSDELKEKIASLCGRADLKDGKYDFDLQSYSIHTKGLMIYKTEIVLNKDGKKDVLKTKAEIVPSYGNIVAVNLMKYKNDLFTANTFDTFEEISKLNEFLGKEIYKEIMYFKHKC